MTLAVLTTGSAIYGVWVLSEHLRLRRSPMDDFAPLLSRGEAWLVCVLAVAAFVGAASLWRMRSLQGGTQLAERLGGHLISGQPRDGLERRLLNVVEEMSIAAGVAVPSVFVLDHEQGINAFAAGFSQRDAAIAVTRGCLEKLTREELQGVIAHELSHVLNGDMQLNLRLVGVVYGIVCIGLFGRLLLQIGASGSSWTRKRNPLAIAGIAGILVVIIGYIGELCGKLIKAAVSRQREFLADASAVQFTRNPAGIAGALRKIGGHTLGARVDVRGADEASHFFFGDIGSSALFPELFATHPGLGDRIRRIDPSFQGEFPALPDGIAEPADGVVGALAPGSASGMRGANGAFAAPAPGHVVEHVGHSDRSALAHGVRLLQALPPALRAAAREPYSACALVYALLLVDDAAVRSAQLQQLAGSVGPGLTRETQRCASLLAAVEQRDRLPLVELLAPALQALSAAQRATFNAVVKALIAADQRMSIFEYVVAHTLEGKSGRGAGGARARSLAAVRGELELLLSLLAYAGAQSPEQAARAFAAGAAQLTMPAPSLVLLPASHRLLSALWPALDALGGLPPLLRAQVVAACAYTTLASHEVTENEWTLLRAVCSALECPLPPSWPLEPGPREPGPHQLALGA